MAKYENTFIALDSETGGLPSKDKPATLVIALTEIALVAVDNRSLEKIDQGSWLIAPYDEELVYSAEAAKVSGISKDMCIKEGLELEEVYKKFVEFLKKHKKGRNKPILIIQNKKFDIPFMENMMAIFKDDLYKYIDRVEDTLLWGRLKWIEKPGFGLGNLAEMCGLDLVQAHRALPDTIITADVWISFMKHLRGQVNGKGGQENKKRFREGFKF